MIRKPLSEYSKLPWENTATIQEEAGLPPVSIVLPIYNAGHFIERTIRSLLFNNLDGVELILMDGGSDDDTMTIVSHYEDIFAHVKSEPDEGQSDAINKGFALASHDIFYWLNGDDIILPNVLNEVRGYFANHNETQVLVGDAYMTERNLNAIRHFQFSPEKLKFEFLIDYASNHLIQPSVFFTRHAWNVAGPVKNNLHYAMDADLFLAMAKHFELQHLPADIAYSVYHEECKTRHKRAESITELSLVQATHGSLDAASKTLGILVELFNAEAAKAQEREADEAAAGDPQCPRCGILNSKLNALQVEFEASRELALKADQLRHG